METVIITLSVAIATALAGFLFGKRREKQLQNDLNTANQQTQEAQILLKEAHERLKETQNLSEQLHKKSEEKAESLNQQIQELTAEKAQALVQIEHLNQRLSEERAEIEKRNEQLKTDFINLSNAILKEQGKDFSALSSNAVKDLVEPMREQLKQMKEQVTEYYDKESKQRSELQGVVKTLSEQSAKISNDANNLANALKGEAKTQGNWGEMILQQLLEQSGLKEGEQYFTQYTITDEHGKAILRTDESDGKSHKMIPDVVVKLPHEHSLIIDSKVSLTAYTDAMNAENESEQKERMKAHVTSVENHINELAKKDYSQYMDGAPGFVVMFIPNEHAYYEAIKSKPNLWNQAWSRNVLLVNQTNLITMIRLSVDLWAQDNREKNYQEVLKRATTMYDKFTTFTEKMTKLGSTVENAKKIYDEALTTLSTGKGNLGWQMEELKRLDMVISNKQAKISG